MTTTSGKPLVGYAPSSDGGAGASSDRELARLTRLYAALSAIHRASLRTTERGALFQRICEILVNEGGFPMAWVGWHDPETQRLLPIASAGDDQGYLQQVVIYTDDRPEGRGPGGIAFREARPYICNDFETDPSTIAWIRELSERGYRALAVIPIADRGQVCGALCVYASERGYFQSREVELLCEAAESVAFALETINREDERKRAATALSNERRLLRCDDRQHAGCALSV